MNTTLAHMLKKGVLVFFDDILVYNSTLEAHVNHLLHMLQLLAHDKWQVKYSKCAFAKRQIDYMGACHIRTRSIHRPFQNWSNQKMATSRKC
jgi:hypothetical protein